MSVRSDKISMQSRKNLYAHYEDATHDKHTKSRFPSLFYPKIATQHAERNSQWTPWYTRWNNSFIYHFDPNDTSKDKQAAATQKTIN